MPTRKAGAAFVIYVQSESALEIRVHTDASARLAREVHKPDRRKRTRRDPDRDTPLGRAMHEAGERIARAVKPDRRQRTARVGDRLAKRLARAK